MLPKKNMVMIILIKKNQLPRKGEAVATPKKLKAIGVRNVLHFAGQDVASIAPTAINKPAACAKNDDGMTGSDALSISHKRIGKSELSGTKGKSTSTTGKHKTKVAKENVNGDVNNADQTSRCQSSSRTKTAIQSYVELDDKMEEQKDNDKDDDDQESDNENDYGSHVFKTTKK